MDFVRENDPSLHKGYIQVILGPTCSGKTTELLRRLQRYSFAKYKCTLIQREKNDIFNHMYDIIYTNNIKTNISDVKDCEVVGIDEGHLHSDIVEVCETLANQGKIVIVATLDGDYSRKPYGKILELIPIAEHVIKLTAVCVICNQDAAFSKMIQKKDKQVYVPVCRKCYFD